MWTSCGCLVDTLLGRMVPPYRKRQDRRVLRPLRAFAEEHRPRAALVVSTEQAGTRCRRHWHRAVEEFPDPPLGRRDNLLIRLPCYPHAVNLDTAEAIFARHADKFITAYVFGSVAAGTADEHSDIDVILVRDTSLPFFDRIREIMDLRLEFGAADLLIYTPAELNGMLAEDGRYFFKHAVRTGHRIEGTQPRSRSVA